MHAKKIITIASIVFVAAALSSCGNTIRGMGKDAANTVDATKSAGHSVAKATK
jgi:entericidin B